LKELAEEEGFADEWMLVERFAAPSLPAVFKPDRSGIGARPRPTFPAAPARLVTALPDEVFAADDSLGWTYSSGAPPKRRRSNERR